MLPAAPFALCQADGRPAANGRYAGFIHNLDTSTWDGQGLRARRRWQRKTWVYFGFFSPRFAVGFAIVDAGYLATAFCYVFDRSSGQLTEENIRLPMGFAHDFHADWRQPWQLSQGGKRWQCVREGDGWLLSCDSKTLQLSAHVKDHARGLSVVSAAPGRPFHHTYKLCGLDAEVNLTIKGANHRFTAGVSMDYTRGYPSRETVWNWASLDGQTVCGQRVAINVVAHFLNGMENALWLGDEIIPLAQTVFDYDPQDLMKPWHIYTLDQRIDITFTPDGRRAEHLNVGILTSDFTQPFGHFEGNVQTANGLERVRGYGVVEAHRAVW